MIERIERIDDSFVETINNLIDAVNNLQESLGIITRQNLAIMESCKLYEDKIYKLNAANAHIQQDLHEMRHHADHSLKKTNTKSKTITDDKVTISVSMDKETYDWLTTPSED